jgi:hypothetical protein
LYTAAGTGQAHHLGYWADDVLAMSAALSGCGWAKVASISVGPRDAAPICAYHQAGAGFYIEIVSRAMRPVLFRTKSRRCSSAPSRDGARPPTLTNITTSK